MRTPFDDYRWQYDPRRVPAGIIDVRPTDEPVRCVQLNIKWASHIVGLLERLCEADAWVGTAEEIDQAIQDTLELQNLFSADMCEGVGNVPVGMMMPYIAPQTVSIPAGWLACEGQLLERDEYPELFEVVGTYFDITVDSEHFRLPDTTGQVIADAGTSYAGVGSAEGETEHTLTIQEMPSHNHTISTLYMQLTGATTGYSQSGSNRSFTAPTIANAGGGLAHNNMQPTIYFRWLVYAGNE